MRYHFQAEQWLPYPVERVFVFFANPDNLPRLMPSWQKTRIDTIKVVPPPNTSSVQTIAGADTTLTLSFRPIPFSPVRLSWDAKIDQFAWNDHFCDTQLRGPFAYWHHCHYVTHKTRDAIEGTLLRDDLEYELPFGFLGQLVHTVAVRRQIRSIFAFRHRRTEELLHA